MTLYKSTLSLLFGIIILMIQSCNSGQKPDSKTPPPAAKKVAVPALHADSAYAFVARQVAFGPRVPNTEANRQCAEYLASTLQRFTPHVQVQKAKVKAYDNTILNIQNIIASFQPDNPRRVLLCAHWDSRPYADHDADESLHRTPIDGANDGASGVGVLLEIARQLSMKPTRVGVDIILFDGEDYGPPHDMQNYNDEAWALGSQYWAKNPHKPGYTARYGILLDMVGASGATFTQEYFSMMYAPGIVDKVWKTAQRLGYNQYFYPYPGGAVNDDHKPINEILDIPTIDIIHMDEGSSNGSFFEYWHTINDKLEHIDKETLRVVGQTVLTVVYEE